MVHRIVVYPRERRGREVSKEMIQLSGIEIVCMLMTVSLEASWTI
jgi:hypothetical protein